MLKLKKELFGVTWAGQHVVGFNIENCPGSLQMACNVCAKKIKSFVNSLNWFWSEHKQNAKSIEMQKRRFSLQFCPKCIYIWSRTTWTRREKEHKLFLISMNVQKPLIDSIIVWCILVLTVFMLHLSLSTSKGLCDCIIWKMFRIFSHWVFGVLISGRRWIV